MPINFGQNIGKNVDKGKVVDGNREGNSHEVDQLAGSRNANDGEEDVPENDLVQEFVVLHPLILASALSSKLFQIWKSNFRLCHLVRVRLFP
jgi:hypothetical protein